jgi:hypothetical protein
MRVCARSCTLTCTSSGFEHFVHAVGFVAINRGQYAPVDISHYDLSWGPPNRAKNIVLHHFYDAFRLGRAGPPKGDSAGAVVGCGKSLDLSVHTTLELYNASGLSDEDVFQPGCKEFRVGGPLWRNQRQSITIDYELPSEIQFITEPPAAVLLQLRSRKAVFRLTRAA